MSLDHSLITAEAERNAATAYFQDFPESFGCDEFPTPPLPLLRDSFSTLFDVQKGFGSCGLDFGDTMFDLEQRQQEALKNREREEKEREAEAVRQKQRSNYRAFTGEGSEEEEDDDDVSDDDSDAEEGGKKKKPSRHYSMSRTQYLEDHELRTTDSKEEKYQKRLREWLNVPRNTKVCEGCLTTDAQGSTRAKSSWTEIGLVNHGPKVVHHCVSYVAFDHLCWWVCAACAAGKHHFVWNGVWLSVRTEGKKRITPRCLTYEIAMRELYHEALPPEAYEEHRRRSKKYPINYDLIRKIAPNARNLEQVLATEGKTHRKQKVPRLALPAPTESEMQQVLLAAEAVKQSLVRTGKAPAVVKRKRKKTSSSEDFWDLGATMTQLLTTRQEASELLQNTVFSLAEQRRKIREKCRSLDFGKFEPSMRAFVCLLEKEFYAKCNSSSPLPALLNNEGHRTRSIDASIVDGLCVLPMISNKIKRREELVKIAYRNMVPAGFMESIAQISWGSIDSGSLGVIINHLLIPVLENKANWICIDRAVDCFLFQDT